MAWCLINLAVVPKETGCGPYSIPHPHKAILSAKPIIFKLDPESAVTIFETKMEENN
jgi:hypothetical protein